MTRLRFEAWTHPGSGSYTKRFDLPRAQPGSNGSRALSSYQDASLLLPANDADTIDQIISGAAGSMIKVFLGDQLIDEFEPQRVVEPSDRSDLRNITGPQRNGLVEGIATLPKNYPEHRADAMDWIWGGPGPLPKLALADLGSIREVWEVHHDHTAGQWNVEVDGDDVDLDHDATLNQIEGVSETLQPPGTGLQGLTTVDDVTVSGSGTSDDPWIITFFAPPAPAAVTITSGTLSGGTTFSATQLTEGAADPTPITISKPINAGTGIDDDYGDYDEPALQVVTTPLDTGADWTLLINATGRFAGSQLVANVKPGRTYSNISVPIYPTITGDYTLVIRDPYGNKVAETTPRNNTLTAGSYTTLTVPTLTVPAGIHQLIIRAAVTDANPANIGDFYVSWQTATMYEGDAATTYTRIIRELLEAGQARGAGAYLELDATDTADTAGTNLTAIGFTAWTGDQAHLGQVLDDGDAIGYRWRIVPAAEAQVITPAGTTSHVLQIYYTTSATIEDLTATPAGPSVLVGGKVTRATTVTRRAPFTTLVGLGAAALSAESTNTTTETALGRIERLADAEHITDTATLADYLTTGHADEEANRTAAHAVVTGSDQTVPLVAYTEGSRIWWQFPQTLTKQARTVRAVSWVHRRDDAEFQLEGSRVLTQQGGIADAVDWLVRQLTRRRRTQQAQAVTPPGEGAQPTYTLALRNAHQLSQAHSHRQLAAGASNAEGQAALEGALNILGAAGKLVLTDGDLPVPNGSTITVPDGVAIEGFGQGVTSVIFDTNITWAMAGRSSLRHLTIDQTGG